MNQITSQQKRLMRNVNGKKTWNCFFLEKNQRIYFWIIIPNDKISFICRFHYVLAFGE